MRPTYEELEQRLKKLELESSRREQAERDLQTSRHHYLKLAENINDIIFALDGQGRFSYINSVAERISGYRVDEIGGQSFSFWAHPDDVPSLMNQLMHTLRGDTNPFEFRIRTKEGKIRHISCSSRPLFDEDEFSGITGIMSDITSRKKTEIELQQYQEHLEDLVKQRTTLLQEANKNLQAEIQERIHAETALLEREQNYRAVLENSPDVYARCGQNYHIHYISSHISSLIGIKPEDFMGHSAREMGFPAEICDLWEAELDKTFASGQPSVHQFDFKLGNETYFVEWRLIPEFNSQGRVQTVLNIARDITKRMQANAALDEMNKRFLTIFNKNPMPMAIFAIESGAILEHNLSFAKTFDLPKDEIIGKTYTELGLIKDEAYKIFVNAALQKKPPREMPLHLANGRVLNGLMYAEAITIADQQCLISLFVDISKRKEAEEERLLLASVIEHATESILITDQFGTILYSNPAYREMTGANGDEIMGANALDFLTLEDQAQFEAIQHCLERQEPFSGRFLVRNRNNNIFTLDNTITPIFDNDGEVKKYISVSRDMTTETELEKKLVQAQKMEAIGTLAGGIAHDFNNILTPIIGYAEMGTALVPDDSKLYRHLEHILKAADRAKEMVKHILTFSRQTDETLENLQIQPIIKESLKLLRSTLPSTIEIRQKLDDNCGPVKADPTQIHQIMMNLCTNAYHAMGEKGGVLSINLNRIHIDPSDNLPVSIAPGNHLRLSISDTGEGIDPKILERIFDPYFTTKEQGKGTGMGLAVVHGIITKCGGDINVYSEPGKGTTFSIYLPEQQPAEAETEHTPTPSYPTGHEHILLVDDEEYIVDMMQDMLQYLGYQVTAHSSSKDALDTFCHHMDRFDLVITDMTMPELTGEEFSREIMLVKPDIPIILCTGFSDIMSEEQAKAAGIKEYIMKPVVMSEIAGTIRRVLDSR